MKEEFKKPEYQNRNYLKLLINEATGYNINKEIN